MVKETWEKIGRFGTVISVVCSVVCVISVLIFILKGSRDIDPAGDQKVISDIVRTAVDSMVVPLRKENVRMQKQNDSLNRVVAQITARDSILLVGLGDNTKQIFDLNKKYNEKISNAGRYDVNDIERFLSERYGKK